MRRAINTCATVALLFGFGGCRDAVVDGSPLIDAVYDETADFSSFSTFNFVDVDSRAGRHEEEDGDDPDHDPSRTTEPPRSLLEVNRIAIQQAIIAEFEERGYVRDTESPDLELTFFVRLQDFEVITHRRYWPNYYWGSYWGYSYPWYRREMIEVEAGTLIVDAVAVDPSRVDPTRDDPNRDDPSDTSNDRLVFRGIATGLLPSQPTDISGQVPNVIGEMFEDWPDAGEPLDR
jgi:hypothetical protein